MNNDYQLKGVKAKREAVMTVSDYADINNMNAISLGLFLFNDPKINVEFTRGRKDHYRISDLNSWIKNNEDKAIKLEQGNQS